MTPKVSIIVPAYNAEAYIGECLDRLCAIDYPDYEVIVVNDGSTDGTAGLAAAFPKPVRVIDIPNGGVSVARNVGLGEAMGEFVLFCDADDYYLPDSLLLLTSLLSDETDIVVAQVFSSKTPRPLKKTLTVSGIEMAYRSLYQKPHFTPSPCAKLFRKSLFDASSLFRPGIRYEDLDLTLRLFTRARKVVVTDAEIYFYRQHSGSFLHQWSSGRLDSLTVTESLVKEAVKFGPDMERAARSRRYSAAWNLLSPACEHGEREVVEHCRKIIREGRLEALLDPEVRLKNKLAFFRALFI